MTGLSELETRVLGMEARAPGRGWRDTDVWDRLGVTAAAYYQALARILADPARLRAARALHPATMARLEDRVRTRGAQRSAWITHTGGRT